MTVARPFIRATTMAPKVVIRAITTRVKAALQARRSRALEFSLLGASRLTYWLRPHRTTVTLLNQIAYVLADSVE